MHEPTADHLSDLRRLVAEGVVRMRWAEEVLAAPAPTSGRRVGADRLRGMLLGLAIGDALGNTSESLLPAERRRRHGEIRGYLPNRHAEGRCVGLPSDDTQLAFFTLEHLLEHGRVEPETLADLFATRTVFGMGRTLRAFRAQRALGRPWHVAAQPSMGNGGLMRIAAVVPPSLGPGAAAPWRDAVLGTALTHNEPASIATSVAYVGLLTELLIMESAPPAEFWVERFVARARPLEGEATAYRPRGGPLVAWRGPLWRFVEEQVPGQADRSPEQAGTVWLSGAYLLETVPTVLHILMRHGDDPEQAVIRAVNETKDNDTVAAIVGAAVGALHGARALPERWRRGLLGRTGAADDGRVQELIELAVQRFLPE